MFVFILIVLDVLGVCGLIMRWVSGNLDISVCFAVFLAKFGYLAYCLFGYFAFCVWVVH